MYQKTFTNILSGNGGIETEMNIGYLGIGERYGASHAGFVHSYSVAKELSNIEGNELTLYLRSPNEGEVKEGFPVKTFDLKFGDFKRPVRTLKQIKQLREELEEYDVIQERFRFNPVNNLITKGMEDKVVLEVNGPAHEKLDFPKKLFIPTIERKFDSSKHIIVQTETLKEIIARHTDTPISVIPNGVDTEKFKPEHEREDEVGEKYGISDEKPVVVFVGSFGDWHGTEKIPEIAEKVPEAQFLLVGDGPMYEEVKEKSESLENVVLTGKVPHEEVAPIIAAANIGIAPFNLKARPDMDENGFYFCPVKIFEYMAAGLPTLSFDLEEIENIAGESGQLAENGDWEHLTEKTKELVESNQLREEKSDLARERAVEKFDWKEIARKTQEVYEEIFN